jgi:hypothetical protein
MNPPKGAGYLVPGATEANGARGIAGAFAPHWRANNQSAPAGSTFRDDDREDLDKLVDQPDGTLAAAIDEAVNNTSLILVFECGDLSLLFPGDAQWGAWNAALKNPMAREILSRTTLYKVGHHGSHNATPRELIETVISQQFLALLSTTSVKQWPKIPRAPLVAAIHDRGNSLVRSDNEATAYQEGFLVQTGLYVEKTFRARL